jgi:hypothetical protein
MCISAEEFVQSGANECPYCQCPARPCHSEPSWEVPEMVHVDFRCRACHARWSVEFVAAGNLRTLEDADPAPPEHQQFRLRIRKP